MLVETPFNHITGDVIAAAIEVRRILGPGLLESTYMTCLRYELSARKLRFVAQEKLPLVQVLTYLNLTGHPVGLLINFNVPKLVDGVRRIINRSWRPT
jgi:hypothetical protein